MAKALTARVVKAITMLGSTQGLNMVCNVVRMKILSLLIGPEGVGFMGALTQASDLIGNLTQLNVRTSAVPQLAGASPEKFNTILICVRRYGRLLGSIGMMLMFLLAPWLSTFTFGSTEFAWAYRLVSVSILLQALQGSELVVLQSTGRYKPIASSGLFTAVCGLALAIPLYWFLREDGIAPSIVGYSVFAWLGAMWFTRKYRHSGPKPSISESLKLGRGFISVGAMLTLAMLIGDLENFVFIAIIRHLGGEETLGVFQSGYTLVWRYTSIFFMAFSMEFYPRIIKVINRRSHVKLLITHQSIVSTWMMFPCSAAMILMAPWLIQLFFSAEFLAAQPYVMWGMVAMCLRPATMTVSYSFLASGRNKIYCLTEICSGLFGLMLNSVAFYLWGFTGLGISSVIWMATELGIVLIAARLTKAPLPSVRAILTTLITTAALGILTLSIQIHSLKFI